jgi:hypothetical protein
MLQIRIVTPNFEYGIAFDNPVILENATDITLSKTVNSSDEGIQFSFPLNDPKNQFIDYTKWWECWDTKINQRINYGPIHSIQRVSGEAKQISGPGRSAILADHYRSLQSFYQPIDQFLDDLRFENLSIQPRTRTNINNYLEDDIDSSRDDYYRVSLNSKDFAIDEQTGYIAIGKDAPARGQIKTNQHWAGTYKSDWLEIDLGRKAAITKVKVLLPWWGGATNNTTRAYDWKWQYSADNANLWNLYGDDYPLYRSWTNVYQSPIPNYEVLRPPDGKILYFGDDGYERNQYTASGSPIYARFWRLSITNTHAWYTKADGTKSDQYNWECRGSNVFLGKSKKSPRPSKGPIIPTTGVNTYSDCYASAVEISLFKTILDRDELTDIIYQEIQNDSKQITYNRTVLAEEMRNHTFKQSDGLKVAGKKFEPGTFFRRGYMSGTTVDVYDEFNHKIWNDLTNRNFKTPAFSRLLKFNKTSARVMSIDAWRGRLDPYSHGGSYVYCTEQNDSAVIDFRGISFKWYATVPDTSPIVTNPDGRQVGQGFVKIEIRSKTGGVHSHPPSARTLKANPKAPTWIDPVTEWSAWETLEDNFPVPVGVSGEKIWEITPESEILERDKSYQIRITNLNAGFVSIDAFAGYWSGSMHELNEDDERIALNRPTEIRQYFHKKYTGGSVYGWRKSLTTGTKQSLSFVGDRVIIYSRKGPNYGVIEIQMSAYGYDSNGNYISGVLRIPTGTVEVNDVDVPTYNSDGRISINLNRSTEIPQYVVFDSNDYFTNGLPWGRYTVYVIKDSKTGPIWIDGMSVHETNGLSVKFLNTSYLDILKSTAEALQMEWEITERGLRVTPRIGYDTNFVAAEGRGATIKIDEADDVSKVATMLLTTGADIEGLPLWTLTENKTNRDIMGRTVQREYDSLRNVADYYTLIGVSRGELLRRREPERRITVTTSDISNLQPGDTFIVKTPELEKRVRANTISRTQGSNGTEYTIECTSWPIEPIVPRTIAGKSSFPIVPIEERILPSDPYYGEYYKKVTDVF